MPSYYSRRPGHAPLNDVDNPFETLTIYVPRSHAAILKSISDKRGLPVSRLVDIAIDNEIGREKPFQFDCDLPSVPYVEYAYSHEAQQIMNYLRKFAKGTGRDMLMLHRRDIGIESKNVFMLAYRELLELKVIEEFMPKKPKFAYNRDYRYVRPVDVGRDIKEKAAKPPRKAQETEP